MATWPVTLSVAGGKIDRGNLEIKSNGGGGGGGGWGFYNRYNQGRPKEVWGPIGNNFGRLWFPVNLRQGLKNWARVPIGSNWSNWLKAFANSSIRDRKSL